MIVAVVVGAALVHLGRKGTAAAAPAAWLAIALAEWRLPRR